MLKLLAFNQNNQAVMLPDFLSLEMHSEEKVPSDLLYIKFPYFQLADSVRTIELYSGDKCVFEGICDEVIFEKSTSGNFVTITFRDKMSLLIDNEALPATYKNVTAQVIFDRYIKKLGFEGYVADNTCLNGEFLIKKGTSVYEVLKAFCSAVYNSTPIVLHNKILFNPAKSNGNTVFSNNATGVPYYKIKLTKTPAELVSNVNVKTSENDFYTTVTNNAFAQSKGIIRERYLDACNESTPMAVAKRIIENSNNKYEEYKIYINDFVDISLKEKCVINDTIYGEMKDLYVSKILNRYTQKGKLAEITLKKEIGYVAT